MIHQDYRKALELCLQNMKTDEAGQVALARAILPILQEISSSLVGFQMGEEDAKYLVTHELGYLEPLVDYLFENFVPEIALPDKDGLLRLLDTYPYDSSFQG